MYIRIVQQLKDSKRYYKYKEDQVEFNKTLQVITNIVDTFKLSNKQFMYTEVPCSNRHTWFLQKNPKHGIEYTDDLLRFIPKWGSIEMLYSLHPDGFTGITVKLYSDAEVKQDIGLFLVFPNKDRDQFEDLLDKVGNILDHASIYSEQLDFSINE